MWAEVCVSVCVCECVSGWVGVGVVMWWEVKKQQSVLRF
jgi:hypothetical protein